MIPPAPSRPELDAKAWRSGPQRSLLLNSERADWTRTPRARRLLVAGYLATTLGIATVIALGRDRTLLIVFLIGVAAVVFLIGSLNAATRGIVDLKTRDIDERQRQERGAVYERSYRIAFLGAVVVLVALAFAASRGHLPDGGHAWVALAYAGFAFLSMLPTLVAAWRRVD